MPERTGVNAEDLISASTALLDLAAKGLARADYLEAVVGLLREWTGCRCIGVRLVDGQGRVPYAAHHGFSDRFWQEEDALLLAQDSCACTRVVRGQPDQLDRPAMTPRGSFCVQELPAFARTLPPTAPFRGRCIAAGFASLAIIPLRYQSRIIGALHLADEVPGRLPAPVLALLEASAPVIATAVTTLDLQDALARSEARYRGIAETAAEGIALLDGRGRITWANARLAELLRMPLAALPGHPLEALVVEADAAVCRDLLRGVQSTGRARADLVLRAAVAPAPWVTVSASHLLGDPEAATLCMFADITARKQAEQGIERAAASLEAQVRERTAALRLSEDRFATAFAASPTAIALTRLADGVILDANPTSLHLLGYRREEVLGRTVEALGIWADPEGRARYIRALRCSGPIQGWEERFVTKRGEVREVLLSADVMEVHGEPVILSTFLDITERKRTEAALRDAQADLNRAQAVARTGSWRLDVGRNELRWSEETYRIFGLPPGTPLTYERFLAAVHPEDRARVDERWAAALRGAPYDIEHRIVVGDAVKWVRERAELEWDGHGQLLGGFGTVQDITDSKAAEARLRESEERFRRLVEVTSQMVWVANAHGEPTEDSPSWRAFTGRRVEEWMGWAWLEAFHPEDRTRLAAAWRAALAGRQPYHVEARLQHASGEYREVVCEAVPLLAADGTIREWIGTNTDITERKRAQTERDSLALFPEQNPFPVLRISGEGRLLYANAASAPLLAVWSARVGGSLPPAARAILPDPLVPTATTEIEVACGDRIYSLVLVPFAGEGYINVYGRDVTARRRSEQALAAQQALLAAVLEQAPDPFVAVDAEGRYVLANSAARAHFNQNPVGKTIAEVMEPLGRLTDGRGRPIPYDRRPLQGALRGERVRAQHQILIRPDGRRSEHLVSATPITIEPAKTPAVALAIILDITAQQAAEAQLRTTLAEKEAALQDNLTLLREVHHRTKNNLQVLCDLLFLKAEMLPDGDAKRHLEDSYGRVYAFARLHEQLHRVMVQGSVPLCDYLAGVLESFPSLRPGIAIRLEAEEVRTALALDLDRAITVGLIVNELLANALAHAFGDRGKGQVVVTVRDLGDTLELRVCDDGVGLPNDCALADIAGLGLRVVRLLVQRLRGSVEIANHQGARVTIRFPRHIEAPREPR